MSDLRVKKNVLGLILLFLPLAVYFDYVYVGRKSIAGYALICLLEVMIFFAGWCFGEWMNN